MYLYGKDNIFSLEWQGFLAIVEVMAWQSLQLCTLLITINRKKTRQVPNPDLFLDLPAFSLHLIYKK